MPLDNKQKADFPGFNVWFKSALNAGFTVRKWPCTLKNESLYF